MTHKKREQPRCGHEPFSQRDTRIRTDDGTGYQYDAIQNAPTCGNCNRSIEVAFACEDVAQLVVGRVLERDDRTREKH